MNIMLKISGPKYGGSRGPTPSPHRVAGGEVLSSTGCAKLEGLPIRAAGEFGKQISFLRKI